MMDPPADAAKSVDAEPPIVELLFFDGCPHHTAFLPHLQELLAGQDLATPVQLVRVPDDQRAQQLRFLGSPSLRVDGVDVEPGADGRSGYGLQCRLYLTPDGPSGTPTDAWVLSALRVHGE